MDKVQKTKMPLTDRNEQAKLIRYLQHLSSIERNKNIKRIENGDKTVSRLMLIMGYGPVCWNGYVRMKNNHNGLICWYCGGRH